MQRKADINQTLVLGYYEAHVETYCTTIGKSLVDRAYRAQADISQTMTNVTQTNAHTIVTDNDRQRSNYKTVDVY